MSETDQMLVLESESKISSDFVYQDEHPQLQMPFSAQIGDRRLEGTSISVTHAKVSGLLPPSGHGARESAVLRFDFEGFSVNLFADVDVEKVGASDNAEICLRFTDPVGSHLAPLRYIMNSHLAGDLVTVGRFLGYTGPTQIKEKTPPANPGLSRRVGNGLRKGGLVVLSLGLIAMAANVVHQRVMFNYEARPVTLAASGETLRATAAGQISYANENARFGEVTYSISANSGDLLSIRMPCDCEVIPLAEFYEGATILAGTPLVKLVSTDATVEATTQISFEGAARLLAGDQPELVLSDGQIVPVTIDLTGQNDGAQANASLLIAQITLVDQAQSDAVIDQTARLRFRRAFFPELTTDGGA